MLARGALHRCMSKREPALGIGEECFHGAGESLGVAFSFEHGRLAVGDDGRDAAAASGNDRKPSRLRFEERHAECFLHGGPQKEVGGAIELLELRGWRMPAHRMRSPTA